MGRLGESHKPPQLGEEGGTAPGELGGVKEGGGAHEHTVVIKGEDGVHGGGAHTHYRERWGSTWTWFLDLTSVHMHRAYQFSNKLQDHYILLR